jgi:trehalose 6-phosphate synthase/phosphatase
MPVWYLYRGLPPDKLCSLYNIADVALVTPLRDGMNLIAKEYVAAKKDENGVLVLSEMAGAVSELAEAVIVNPNNREEVADALQKALNLSEELRRKKIRAMKKRLERYNVEAWARDFIRIVGQVTYNQKEISTRRLVQAQQNTLIQNYRKAQNRLIFLDYDGTLVPFQERPEKARPDEEIYALIQGLVRDTKNEVILVSGRDKKTLDEWFGHLNIGLSAEHGVWIKINRRTWAQVEHLKSDWKEQIRPMLEIYVDRTPGSFIEEKSYSLAWHYRKTNPELGMVRARELREEMLHITANLDLMVLEGSKVIEVKSRGINKGRAAMQWMNERKWDFILAFGDDWTDEDLFEALPESAHTIKIGLGVTKARFYVTDYTDVRQILNLIVKS